MDTLSRALRIKDIQSKAISSLEIGTNYQNAIGLIIEASQRHVHVITTGMGKAGIIAMKMSATMASIGIPSFSVNPAEALHGDLGRITPNDLVIAFSHSGTTPELKAMLASLNSLNQNQNQVILIGGNENPDFPCSVVLSYGQIEESCVVPNVPSTSTTLMALIGDILAITSAECLGLDQVQFKARHPGGAIGLSYRSNET